MGPFRFSMRTSLLTVAISLLQLSTAEAFSVVVAPRRHAAPTSTTTTTTTRHFLSAVADAPPSGASTSSVPSADKLRNIAVIGETSFYDDPFEWRGKHMFEYAVELFGRKREYLKRETCF